MSDKIKYRKEIDGLRTIAVVGVLLYHAELVLAGENPIPGGYLGVDVFFVISGYLISSIILRGLGDETFRFLDFYSRRARRILPILFTVILTSLPFAWRYLLPQDMIDYCYQIISSIFFSSNFYFWLEDPYWATDSSLKPFLHTWTLAVEEQFYLVIPPLLILLHRYVQRHIFWVVLALAVASLAFSEWASGAMPDVAFYLLPSRMWELFAGVLLAVLGIRRQRPYEPRIIARFLPTLGLAMIVVPMFVFTETTRHPSLLTAIPIVGTMLVIWFASPKDIATRLLSTPLMVGIGLISYGLYMWHFPVFAFANIATQGDMANHVRLSLAAASIGLAVISYYLIEQPLRHKRTVPNLMFTTILVCMLVPALTVSAYGHADGFKSRFPELINVPGKPRSVPNHVWFEADDPSVGRIISVGDSHMDAMSATLKNMANAAGYDYANSSFAGCLLMIEVDRINRKTSKPHKHCRPELQTERLKFISNAEPSFVVVGGRLPLVLEEERFDNQEGGREGDMNDIFLDPEHALQTKGKRKKYIKRQYRKTIKKILDAGHTVILVYPIPEVGWNVPKILMKKIDGNYQDAREIAKSQPITTDYKVYQKRTKSAYKLLNSIKGDRVLRVYPEELFCNTTMPSRCVTHDDEHVYYRDDDHPSDTGAEMLGEVILEKVQGD